MTIKISKNFLWLALPLLFLFFIQFLNQTGFCYSDMRYLNERELIDRHLFGIEADKMSIEEKLAALERLNKDGGRAYILSDYPECCRITKGHSDIFSFKNFVGDYYYFLNINLMRREEGIKRYDKKAPYFETIFKLKSCGIVSDEVGGITKSKKSYEMSISTNRKYWEEKAR